MPGGTVVQRLSAASLDRLDELLERIVSVLVEIEPVGLYNDESTADLRAATRAGLLAVLGSLAGELPESEALEVPRQTGRRQVQQDLPLEGVLRAYRMAGKLLWEDFVAHLDSADARDLLNGASEVWRVIDCFSQAAADGYRDEEATLRRHDARVQSSLLAALLEGRGADPQFARDAQRALGVPGPWACVVGLADKPGELALERPADRLAAAGVDSVWVSTATGEVGLLPATTVAKVQRALAERIRGRAGISPAVATLAELPAAQRLAEVAARASGSRRLAQLDDDLVASLACDSPLVAEAVWDRTVGALLRAARDDGADLVSTAQAFLAANASLNVAATSTHMHRNTMLYRLNKIERLTGLSLRDLGGQVLWAVGLGHHRLRTTPFPAGAAENVDRTKR